MLPNELLRTRTPARKFSRRGFLSGVACDALTASAFTQGRTERTPRAAGAPVLAYVGTYSSPQGPEGSKGYGKGIYLFEMNPVTGALSPRDVFPNGSNPSWLAFNRSRTPLYSANETATYAGRESGSVSAYRIDRRNGRLALLNTVSSEGSGPCHLSVHPSGKFVLVANYHGGTIAVLPIGPQGELNRASDVKRDQGSPGPAQAASAPPGSFAIFLT